MTERKATARAKTEGRLTGWGGVGLGGGGGLAGVEVEILGGADELPDGEG